MESGAQVAGGVNIFPKEFQGKISRLCKKYNVLLVLDEIATGFGRLGSMIQYTEQKSITDIVAYGKMLTGGYLTMAATLTTKKIYESFLGEFNDWKHLFHGHTFTRNPLSAAVANENLKLYEKNNLIKKIQKTSKVFEEYYDKIMEIETVGDIRHKGMLMGIELVKDKKNKIPIHPKKSINKKALDELGFQDFGLILDNLNFGALQEGMLNSLLVDITSHTWTTPRIQGLIQQLSTYRREDDKPGKNLPQDLIMTMAQLSWLARGVPAVAFDESRPTANYLKHKQRTSVSSMRR